MYIPQQHRNAAANVTATGNRNVCAAPFKIQIKCSTQCCTKIQEDTFMQIHTTAVVHYRIKNGAYTLMQVPHIATPNIVNHTLHEQLLAKKKHIRHCQKIALMP
jgi:hypothetical protein